MLKKKLKNIIQILPNCKISIEPKISLWLEAWKKVRTLNPKINIHKLEKPSQHESDPPPSFLCRLWQRRVRQCHLSSLSESCQDPSGDQEWSCPLVWRLSTVPFTLWMLLDPLLYHWSEKTQAFLPQVQSLHRQKQLGPHTAKKISED